MTLHTFNYGHGQEAVQIAATLPLRVCGHCDFEYFDKAGQEARHEAVCRHLGVMTPGQIRRLREYHGLSRAEFANLTGLGEATIARWERGALIQNTAHDLYLRLLGFEENLERLRKQKVTGAAEVAPTAPAQRPTFPALGEERTAVLLVEQAGFRL
jgi:DNA-binding transcriptional regulator YiaG